jgi:uncharacterized protein YbjT (DUF2867 family)
MAKKILAVMGATGAQGGGVVRAALADPSGEFAVRAITRNAKSDKAVALAAAGAEVVAADADDPVSLGAAFAGAHGVFAVTNFWEHFSPERELVQAYHIANAAKAAGTAHLVWSTLEDTRRFMALNDDRMPTLMGSYKVPHFDAKGQANSLFDRLGVPTTHLNTSFYWDNLIHFGSGPQRGADGVLSFVLPMADKKLPGIAAEDIGKCAFGVFRRPELIGKTVGIAGEHLTGEQMAAALTEALGEKVVYNYVPPEVYRTFGFPGADDLANMFQFKRDFNDAFVGGRDLAFSRQLNPELQTFATWLARHGKQIPLG